MKKPLNKERVLENRNKLEELLSSMTEVEKMTVLSSALVRRYHSHELGRDLLIENLKKCYDMYEFYKDQGLCI